MLVLLERLLSNPLELALLAGALSALILIAVFLLTTKPRAGEKRGGS